MYTSIVAFTSRHKYRKERMIDFPERGSLHSYINAEIMRGVCPCTMKGIFMGVSPILCPRVNTIRSARAAVVTENP